MASHTPHIILQCIDPPYRCTVAYIIDTITANPAYVNVPNAYGWTPLRCAVSLWSEDDALHLVTALLRCGADARMASTKGLLNPVHEAARKGRLELIKAFAAHDPTLLETEAGGGLRALHYAVESKSRNMALLKFLVEIANVNVQALTVDNNSCLHYAGAVGWADAFSYLENRGVQANTLNSNGWTAYGKLHASDVRLDVKKLDTVGGRSLTQLSALTIMALVPVGTEETFLDELNALPPGSLSTTAGIYFHFYQVWHSYTHDRGFLF
ncbi:hypothetical protein Pelo_2804 [Pelomyxa schiedti]|nr:hypothetical protein Pelo_2804 [Pelomyxa schiedti]